MTLKTNIDKLKIGIVILIVLLVAAAGYTYAMMGYSQTTTTGIDNGNSGPATSFTNYTPPTSQWQSITSSTTQVTFSYPVSLSTNYIQTVDWPPAITVSNDAFSCNQNGSAIAPNGKTTSETINNTNYCVTVESQGAAGSVYNQYMYAFSKEGYTLTFNFTLRYPQCVNYPDPQMTACKTEESSFNVDTLANAMMQTVQYAGAIIPTHPMAPTPNPSVELQTISPSSGAVGTTIILTGSGFLANNKVLFDGNVGSASASPSSMTGSVQTITVSVPSSLTADCKADEACPMYARLVTPGTYPVTIENANGTSNAVSFVVTQ